MGADVHTAPRSRGACCWPELISSACTGFAVTQEGRTASFSSQRVSLGNSTSSHTSTRSPQMYFRMWLLGQRKTPQLKPWGS